MVETLRLGEVVIAIARKDVKHVHLSVHPPHGRVTLVAPRNLSAPVLPLTPRKTRLRDSFTAIQSPGESPWLL